MKSQMYGINFCWRHSYDPYSRLASLFTICGDGWQVDVKDAFDRKKKYGQLLI